MTKYTSKNPIPLFKVNMHPDAALRAGEVLNSGYIGQGPVVEEYELKLADFIGNKRIATVNSATSGLHLALHLLKPDIYKKVQRHALDSTDAETSKDIAESHFWDLYADKRLNVLSEIEVLTSPMTCTATNWPILANGYKIKWVDIDNSMNMDLDDLERKISPKTRIIMLVHWAGNPINLERVNEIRRKCYDTYGFYPAVIEDCAHAFGAEFDLKKIGNHGNIAVFSTQAIKHLTSVDGGFMALPNQTIYNAAILQRWYGIDRNQKRADFRCENDIEQWGFKFHMNDVSAAVGLANLDSAIANLSQHRRIAEFYRDEFGVSDIEGLRWPSSHNIKPEHYAVSSHWIYTIYVERRDDFMKAMLDRGVVTSKVHERNDKHTTVEAYKAMLPQLDKLNDKICHIPIGHHVSMEDAEYIVDQMRKGW